MKRKATVRKRKRSATKRLTVEDIYRDKLILVAATVAMSRKDRWKIRLNGTTSQMSTSSFIARNPSRTKTFSRPAVGEWRKCCDEIREPSLRFPNVYSEHVKTARHVANLYGVKETTLRAAIRLLKPAILTAERLGQSQDRYLTDLIRGIGGVALW